MSDSQLFSDLALVFLLVLANWFFVVTEFSIVRSHPTVLRDPKFKKKFGAQFAEVLVRETNVSLSAAQLGITIASLLLGWEGVKVFQALFRASFDWIGEPISIYMSGGASIGLALAVVVFLHVVLGELTAKSVALKHPETVLRWVGFFMYVLVVVFKPILSFLYASANFILKPFGFAPLKTGERLHTSTELALMVAQSGQGGMIDKDEEQMLKGVFSFSDTVAREVMTPRTDLVCIPVNASLEEVVTAILSSNFSRYPVSGESFDNIVGVLVAKDVVPYIAKQTEEEFSVKKVMRDALFVPETKPIDDLLNDFKKRKIHMAIVVDEHGGVGGVVTFEDLIEEIVGDIYDESDTAEKDVIEQSDGDLIVDGRISVADLNSRFMLGIPEGAYDTLAGFVFNFLGRIPQLHDRLIIVGGKVFYLNGKGEAISASGGGALTALESSDVNSEETDLMHNGEPKIVLSVEKVRGQRIETIRIKRMSEKKHVETIPLPIASQIADVESKKVA